MDVRSPIAHTPSAKVNATLERTRAKIAAAHRELSARTEELARAVSGHPTAIESLKDVYRAPVEKLCEKLWKDPIDASMLKKLVDCAWQCILHDACLEDARRNLKTTSFVTMNRILEVRVYTHWQEIEESAIR